MNSPSTANKAEVVSIQYLRGVAAMSVALFHTSVNMPTFAWPSSLARDFGDCGIDVFFVISGFVMFFVTKDNSMSSETFLLRRFIRIAPLVLARDDIVSNPVFGFRIRTGERSRIFSYRSIHAVHPACESGNWHVRAAAEAWIYVELRDVFLFPVRGAAVCFVGRQASRHARRLWNRREFFVRGHGPASAGAAHL